MAFSLASAVVLALLYGAKAGPIEIHVPSENCTTTHSNAIENAVGSCDFQSYIALGDSYAAGINSQPSGTLPTCSGNPFALQPPYCNSNECARNYGAYPWQFGRLHARNQIQFMACSGAGTGACENLQVIPTLHALTNEDLITITIGGNNGNAFSTIVKKCVYGHTNARCASALSAALTTINAMSPALDDLFASIHGPMSPRVFVMGYAWFWPPGSDDKSRCQSWFLKQPTYDQKMAMNNLVTAMNSALANAAASHGYTFVNPNAGFDGHRLCDTGAPWFQYALLGSATSENTATSFEELGLGPIDGLDPGNALLPVTTRGVFHPTAEGQMVYMHALEQALECA